MKLFTLILAALILAGCPRAPVGPTPAELDAGAHADECVAACANVDRLQCLAGDDSQGGESCAALCRRVRDRHLTNLDIACARTAASKLALSNCVGWGCLP